MSSDETSPQAGSKKDSARNPFELFFLEAARDPLKELDFYRWVAKAEFIVPCQGVGALDPSHPRRLVMGPHAAIRFKAFSHQDQLAIPFFSELRRFESWSAPDPQGQYVLLRGEQFFGMIPRGSAALLNPGSEELSKWFTPEEIREHFLEG